MISRFATVSRVVVTSLRGGERWGLCLVTRGRASPAEVIAELGRVLQGGGDPRTRLRSLQGLCRLARDPGQVEKVRGTLQTILAGLGGREIRLQRAVAATLEGLPRAPAAQRPLLGVRSATRPAPPAPRRSLPPFWEDTAEPLPQAVSADRRPFTRATIDVIREERRTGVCAGGVPTPPPPDPQRAVAEAVARFKQNAAQARRPVAARLEVLPASGRLTAEQADQLAIALLRDARGRIPEGMRGATYASFRVHPNDLTRAERGEIPIPERLIRLAHMKTKRPLAEVYLVSRARLLAPLVADINYRGGFVWVNPPALGYGKTVKGIRHSLQLVLERKIQQYGGELRAAKEFGVERDFLARIRSGRCHHTLQEQIEGGVLRNSFWRQVVTLETALGCRGSISVLCLARELGRVRGGIRLGRG